MWFYGPEYTLRPVNELKNIDPEYMVQCCCRDKFAFCCCTMGAKCNLVAVGEARLVFIDSCGDWPCVFSNYFDSIHMCAD